MNRIKKLYWAACDYLLLLAICACEVYLLVHLFVSEVYANLRHRKEAI